MSEGTSDRGIVDHIAAIGRLHEQVVVVTAPEFEKFGRKVGSSVEAKLKTAAELGEYDVVAVHRDADNAGRQARTDEIEGAVQTVFGPIATIRVIPVRMTEAWLLADEAAIRAVAGNPNGRSDLGLPHRNELERNADPKHVLRGALAAASEHTGRRLSKFKERFSSHRAQLLERLTLDGPHAELESWKEFVLDVERAIGA